MTSVTGNPTREHVTGRLAAPMEADRPPPDPASTALAEAVPSTSASKAPAVVAVVVARGAAPHLEATLGSLGACGYPDLTVLVVAATDEDLRARVAAVLPEAFVKAVGAEQPYTAAANEARSSVAGAPFLLFCHDDVVVEPGAIRFLVAEAYRSNAAVVGPKIVEVDRPEVLREVGWSVDRFGQPHSEIQPDELDQEQHDAVRDVFFVGDACVLVRADLFAALGGYDEACDPGAHMIDLCWRARLVAARVMVAPDARVRHHAEDPPVADEVAHRHRVRALLTATGTLRLLWLVPAALALHGAEVLVFLARRDVHRARGLIGGWWWNVRHLRELREARGRAQGSRTVHDREVRAFQYHGSARISSYVANSLQAPDRVRGLSERSREMADSANTQVRSVRGMLVTAVLVLVLIGVRDLILGRVAAVGELAPWPSFGDLVRAFTSQWRFAGLGAESPAPPLTAVAATLRFVTLGAGGLGQTLLIVGAIPAGMLGAARVARVGAGRGWPAVVAAVTYGVLPLPRNAIEHGHLGSLLLYAAAPWLVLGLLALADLAPSRWSRRRVIVTLAGGTALVTVFWPPALAFVPVVVAGFALASPVIGDARSVRGMAQGAAVATGAALALLIPWPLALISSGDRLGLLGIVGDAPTSFAALLRFQTGASGAGIGGWAFLAAGLLVVFIVSGPATVWCWRWWAVAAIGWTVASMPGWFDGPSPATEGLLVPAALAIAQLCALGAAGFVGELRRRELGWAQVAAVTAAGALAVGGLGFLGDVPGGRFHQPSDDWSSALSWMRAQRDAGPFRVLWFGTPNALPGATHRAGPDAFAVTVDGPGDLRALLPPPGGRAQQQLTDRITLVQDRATTRFGWLVAPMAVRYVVVPSRAAPDAAPGRRPIIAAGLVDQLDLAVLQSAPGITVYENRAWVPADARLAPASVVGAGVRAPQVVDAEAPGLQLWSEQYAPAWRAVGSNGPLEHRRVDGWAEWLPDRRWARERDLFPAMVAVALVAPRGGRDRVDRSLGVLAATASRRRESDAGGGRGHLVTLGRRFGVVAGLIALFIVLGLLTNGTSVESRGLDDALVVAPEGEPSTWYCAEGTAARGVARSKR